MVVALRLGLFQIAFSDRIPARAAVDTSVALIGRHAPHAKGFVNAVLRRAAREGLAASPEGSEVERLAVELSHPTWLVRLWTIDR